MLAQQDMLVSMAITLAISTQLGPKQSGGLSRCRGLHPDRAVNL